MKKNKISGVQPFNDFLFRSCYYHQLISGLSCFGIDKETILLNAFVSIQSNFEANSEDIIQEVELAKLLGYKSEHCNINCAKLIRSIDNGCPVIVGVDCYYLENRPDTYLIRNAPHFILVYGYDLEKRIAYVVDHEYLNSDDFKECEFSLDNLLFANKMFRKGVLNRKLSCYILKRKKKQVSFNILHYIDEGKIIKNQENSIVNLISLREIFVNDLEFIRKNISEITMYFSKLKTFYYTLSRTELFASNQSVKENCMILASAYSNILSLFWKVKAQNNYNYISKKQS